MFINKTETDGNDARNGSSLVSLHKKIGALNTPFFIDFNKARF